MDDDSDRSSEATQLEEDSTAEETKLHDDGDGEDFGAVSEDEEDDEETDDQTVYSALEVSPMLAEEDSITRRSSALVPDLSEVPVKYEMRRHELEHLKSQLQGSHQEALAIVIAQAAQAHSVSHIKSPGFPLPSELSSMPVTSILSLPLVNASRLHVAEANQDSSDPKIPIDDYNWRKYGQKQVKSPEGSRSYYKCTYTECEAKKIESCDQYDSITKIVYKGQHKHDPPKRVLSRGGKITSTPKALKRKSIAPFGSNEHQSSGSGGGDGSILIEQMEAPQRKQRVKKISLANPGSVLKPPKKPKFIVHAAGDIEISADGYRWRKYGQKMVKGNPHPRNYYKCTSAGCPVRKHTEKAVDDISEVIITYKGDHDHDMPVPKKRQGPPSGLLIKTSQPNKSKPLWTQGSTTGALNGVGVMNTSEPARNLLSVGFEIKNC